MIIINIIRVISVQRIRHYMDWSVNSIQYLAMKEVHSTFLECFLKTAASFSKDDGKDLTTFRSIFSLDVLA